MDNKEKMKLLLKDLCGRLPYKVKGRCKWIAPMTKSPEDIVTVMEGKKIRVRYARPCAAQIDGDTVLNVSEYEAEI